MFLLIIFVYSCSITSRNRQIVYSQTIDTCASIINFFNQKKICTSQIYIFYRTQYNPDSFFKSLPNTKCFSFNNSKEIVSKLGKPIRILISKRLVKTIDSTYFYKLQNDSNWNSSVKNNYLLFFDFIADKIYVRHFKVEPDFVFYR